MYMGYSVLARLVTIGLLGAFLFGCATPTDPFEVLAVGDSHARVVQLLGSPLDPAQDMTQNERLAVQGAIDATDKKGAVSISIWKQGSERFEIVGFDRKGLATFKRRFFYRAP